VSQQYSSRPHSPPPSGMRSAEHVVSTFWMMGLVSTMVLPSACRVRIAAHHTAQQRSDPRVAPAQQPALLPQLLPASHHECAVSVLYACEASAATLDAGMTAFASRPENTPCTGSPGLGACEP